MLGILGAETDTGERLALGGPSERKVLAVLLLNVGRLVPVTRMVDALWDDNPPATAVKQVQNAVGRLRRLLARSDEPCVIMTAGAGYQLRVADDMLDARLFEARVAQAAAAGSAGDLTEATALLKSALDLWRGPALAGLSGRAIEAAADGWNERQRATQETYYEHRLALGEHRVIVGDLMPLVSAYPMRERLAAQLMLALYRCDRQAEALEVYRRARAVLTEELGLDPGSGLQLLHQQILARDPALELPAPDRAGARAANTRRWPTVPKQLPAAVRSFVGRRAELETLTRWLDDPGEQTPGAVVITAIGGTAGIGKTTLAVRWAHQAADRFPDGQLYVNLRGYDPDRPMPAAEALTGFLRALGVSGQDIPAGEADRAAQYRSLLAGRRVLVIIDNAGSAEQVRPLLPGTPSCAAVVTSRDALAGLVALDGALRLDLDLLSIADAVGLLRALIGPRVDADPGAAADLATQCARLPIALRVAAELAATRPDMPLAGLTGELADRQRRLELLDAGGDPRAAVRAVFSWSCRHLETEAARMFRLLGLHPGPDLGRYAAAALTGTSVTEARENLAVLARACLIQPTTPGRYGMHDLLRAYAHELTIAHDGAEDQRAALTRLFDHYLHTAARAMDTLFPAQRPVRPHIPAPASPALPLADPAAARAWLDGERATIVAVAGQAAQGSWPGHATRLAATLICYLQNGDHYLEAITIHGHAHQAARRLGDRAAEASALTSLGKVDWVRGRGREAASRFQEAVALCRAVGDRAEQARAVNSLGLVDVQQGRYQQAADCFQEALALYRECGDHDGQAVALGNLGAIDRRQGRYPQAIDCQQQALALFRELGDVSGECTTLTRLGVIAMQTGRPEQAAGYLEQALVISCDIGDRDSQASALTRLGDAMRQMRRYPQAIEYHRQALALSHDIGAKDGETIALNGLGEALLAAGQPGTASAQHTAALRLASEAGDSYQQARAHNGLGRVCHATGDCGKARDHWRRALALYAALGAPEAGQVRAQLDAGDCSSNRAGMAQATIAARSRPGGRVPNA